MDRASVRSALHDRETIFIQSSVTLLLLLLLLLLLILDRWLVSLSSDEQLQKGKMFPD